MASFTGGNAPAANIFVNAYIGTSGSVVLRACNFSGSDIAVGGYRIRYQVLRSTSSSG